VRFIKLKNVNADKVDWLISERTKAIEKFFTKVLSDLGLEYLEDRMLVCEPLELVKK